MKIEIGILQEGDEILGMWENRILVKHKNGEAEFFIIEIDDNGMPRINNDMWLITYGDREIKVTDLKNKSKRKTGKKKPSEESKALPEGKQANEDSDNGVTVITFQIFFGEKTLFTFLVNMPCRICGKAGHNSRTCPDKEDDSNASEVGARDRMLIAIDYSSEEKLHEIASVVMKAKREIDPDARGTIVIGNAKELPHKMFKLLEGSEQIEGSEADG